MTHFQAGTEILRAQPDWLPVLIENILAERHRRARCLGPYGLPWSRMSRGRR